MNRRSFVGGMLGGTALMLSGCLSSSDTAHVANSTPTCQQSTREHTRTVYDELDSWDAGAYYTWSLELDAGDTLEIDAVQVEGARPALVIKNPNGDVVTDVEPTAAVERTFDAPTDGTYYLTLSNEAMLTSGQWDVEITVADRTTIERCD